MNEGILGQPVYKEEDILSLEYGKWRRVKEEIDFGSGSVAELWNYDKRKPVEKMVIKPGEEIQNMGEGPKDIITIQVWNHGVGRRHYFIPKSRLEGVKVKL